MTLEQIDYFICAAQSRTFFDAAEAMHISQSSLSKQIMKLEKELELTLWDRSKRTAVLTPEGEFFYKEALKISRQYHRSLEEVEDEELLSGLEKDLFNLIFVRKHMIDPELYTFHALTADRLVAVFPEAHPSASKKSVSLSELKKESFILMPPHTSIYRFCMQSFHNAGIHPQLLRTARAESIVSAVEIGEGISLLTESSFQFFRQPSLVAVPVNGLEKLSIGIAHKKNMALTTSAECFLQFVKSHM